MGEARDTYKILIGKFEGKMPLVLHRCRSKLETITKMCLKEIRYQEEAETACAIAFLSRIWGAELLGLVIVNEKNEQRSELECIPRWRTSLYRDSGNTVHRSYHRWNMNVLPLRENTRKQLLYINGSVAFRSWPDAHWLKWESSEWISTVNNVEENRIYFAKL